MENEDRQSASAGATDLRKVFRCLAVSGFATAITFPIAAGFSVPVSYTYIQWPGVVLFVLNAILSVVCFFRCPRHPVWAKVLTGIFTLPPIFFAMYGFLYYPGVYLR
jgi:hypothetical protein